MYSVLYELIGLYVYILWCDSGNREYNCRPICHQQSSNILMTLDTFRIDHLSTGIPTKFHHCVCVSTCWPTPNQVLMWQLADILPDTSGDCWAICQPTCRPIVHWHVNQVLADVSTNMSTEYRVTVMTDTRQRCPNFTRSGTFFFRLF